MNIQNVKKKIWAGRQLSKYLQITMTQVLMVTVSITYRQLNCILKFPAYLPSLLPPKG